MCFIRLEYENSILDINATLKPHFAIVDGIVGMEGDGPIMGDPKKVGVLVMGRNFAAVDATCCRIMGIDPYKVSYLERADNWLGPIAEGVDRTARRVDCRGTNELQFDRTRFRLIRAYDWRERICYESFGIVPSLDFAHDDL